MNYTNYNDNPISREQYITLGLERGELLVRLECGCVIIQDRTADAYIVFCHNHQAAPDLYEAAKEIMERFNGGTRFPLQSSCDKMNQALDKAEGK